MAKKKGAPAQEAQSSSATPAPPQSSSLSICRNKHWKYISSYHGPWLQLPAEILDQLAHQNFTMPAPRLIDPAVFYDVVKIRKAVDEASEDSVRASTGLSSTAMNGRMDYLGAGGGGGQLSKERIFRIRQKAVRNLSKAFTLDEVAASVASMQATSTIEDVGSHVLKREPHNVDAQYVHFFHEKIPSRAMEQYTPLEPLDDILNALPIEMKAPQLRTRSLVQNFKHQWEGSILDLTSALRIVEENKRVHKPNQQELELASKMRKEQESWNGGRDWRNTPHLKEEDQPTSLEQQLLFNRGGVYLKLACQSVDTALNGLKECMAKQEAGERLSVQEQAAQAERLEARKKVKGYAKRALKDYMGFLAFFDYTPGLSFETTNEIMRRVYDLANGNKLQKTPTQNRLTEVDSSDDETQAHGHSDNFLVRGHGNGTKSKASTPDEYPHIPAPKIYPTSALFAEKQPTDLPQFPSAKMAAAMQSNDQTHDSAFNSREAVTYHPLLTDALHSLLLSHALCQTSSTEHLRHAHNVARLARIADGYPIFQAARSPARADWIEVLRRANNWLGLSVSWQRLCAPAPLPDAAGGWAKDKNGGQSSALTKRGGATGSQRNAGVPPKDETPAQKRERIKQESILDALSDDRVVDEESFNRAVRARERRAMDDEEGLSGPLRDRAKDDSSVSSPVNDDGSEGSPEPVPVGKKEQPKRWAQEDGAREYPISTDRAEAVARWIKEAPVSMPGIGGKKRRRPVRKRAPAANGVAEAVERMKLDGGGEEGPD